MSAAQLLSGTQGHLLTVPFQCLVQHPPPETKQHIKLWPKRQLGTRKPVGCSQLHRGICILHKVFEVSGFLGYDAMQRCIRIPAFQKTLLPSSAG